MRESVEETQYCRILFCTCHHDWQDKEYGKNRRVCNQMNKKDTYRCTVCGKEISI